MRAGSVSVAVLPLVPLAFVVIVTLVTLVTLVGGAGCGGSASETPWPVEPDSFKAGMASLPGEAAVPSTIIESDAGGAVPRAYPTAP